ncbi:hypothetical protein OOK44_38445 [Streptomyces cellulosae]|uniref:DUF7739 domain-containing protein n=1 Tax=Streptomyces TaxID=1883 RepID=UPI0018ACB799|nr:hypothetical protein [Streptomyces sp. BRB081]MBL3808456.1 hypothetical protein [Streptomyces sp. BRB081]MCX4482234.1 hypothetical protein [Streptomyces cellulosae]MCX4482259.1 hypothetical protein [Streptomyces cellulosae]
MATHVIVSHGADFEGVDRFTVTQLRELGKYVRGVLPYDDCPKLTALLDEAGTQEHAFAADEAALLAVLFRRAAAHRALAKKHAGVALLLGLAAAQAVEHREPWTWTLEEVSR